MPTSSIPAMSPAIRLGLRSAWRIRGYRVSTITPATAKDTPTSRGVWTPRYSREHCHAGPPDPGPPGGPGNAAEGGHGVLGVAAGEGVARGLGPGAFHNGEVRVPDPGPGNPEQQLQKLVHHRAEKAHQQQVIPLLLADTPENQNGRHHENGLLAQVGHGGEHRVPEWGAHALQRI